MASIVEDSPNSIDPPMPSGKPQTDSQGYAWKIALLFTSLIAIATVIAMFATGGSSSKSKLLKNTTLTHTISRGNLEVTVREQGTLESGENTEIKCKVRGQNTVISVVEGGTEVKKGDVLVRLDTLFIEEQINERSKYAHWSRSASERSKADVARAELAISEYLEGRYKSELMTIEKDLAIAQSNLRTAQSMLTHAKTMAERGYVSKLQVEQREFSVTQAELDVEVKRTNIDVLKRFTKAEQLEMLRGGLSADKARHAADVERAYADAHRRDRALEELEYCTIKAPRDGLVIYPSAAKWKTAPDIEEGASVHKDQILLLMPDLSRMQVKIGVHESIIDKVSTGIPARITLTDRKLKGEVSTVASVTQPAGWWTGNVVKYDTIVSLPPEDGLKPGMSAEVEVILATYEDVLTIPVVAVAETSEGPTCWVKKTNGEPEKRLLTLGDNNGMFMIVEEGVEEGEDVILNPLALVEEAQEDALKPVDTTTESIEASKAAEIGSAGANSDDAESEDSKSGDATSEKSQPKPSGD